MRFFITITWFCYLLVLTTDMRSQVITTYAGNGSVGSMLENVPATSTNIGLPGAGSFDAAGNYYFATGQSRVKKVTPLEIMSTVAGNGTIGFSDDNGPATAAQIHCAGMHVDSIGNIYIADYYNFRVRKVDVGTGIIHTIAGLGVSGAPTGNGGPATAAITTPQDVTTDDSGNVYISDGYYVNPTIRKIDLAGNISFVANGGGYISFDIGCHHLYMALGTHILRLTMSSGMVDTIAGTGLGAYNGDEIPATAANFGSFDVVSDNAGNIYIADYVNDRIRKIDHLGIIHTIAGTGIEGYNGDNIPATDAQLWNPEGIAFDKCGNLYIADDNNKRIRKVTFNTSTTDTPTLTLTTSTTSPICSGTTVTYTTTISGGSTTTNYSWYINSIVVAGATSNTYSYAPAAGDTVTCRVVTFNNCSLPSTATSNGIVLTVNPVVTPAITITASPNDTVCTGVPVTLNASITNGGTTPTYQWYKNGAAVSTAATYSYTPANSDSVRCVLTSNAACATSTVANSNSITLTVLPNVTPTIVVSIAPNDTVCAGTAVTLTPTITNAGTAPSYTWYKNGSPVSLGAMYSYTPANNDSVRCTLISNAACATPAITYSNGITITVLPYVTPSISISISPNDTVCNGTVVTLTAAISNGGSSPAYTWRVNGALASWADNFSYPPDNNDTVRCTLISNVACVTTPIAYSNSITITTYPNATPVISIAVSPGDTICSGTAVTFNSAILGGGSSPVYQWLLNGSPSGGGTTFAYTPANGDLVSCILTNNDPCVSVASVTSNSILMTVDTITVPVISITGVSTAAVGITVTITAAVANAGSSYTIYWMNHGVAFATTTVPEVSYTKGTDTDTITAKIVSAEGCYDSTTSAVHVVTTDKTGIATISNSVHIYPNPAGNQLYVQIISPATYRLMTMDGKSILSGIANAGQNSIDISHLSSGVYILELTYSTGERAIAKVQKQ
jgi:hypothetical protein